MATRHRLSTHFTVEEFDCHDGHHVPESAIDDIIRLCEWILEPMRTEFGRIEVISGYRTIEHNRSVGGAPHSVHLLKTPLPGSIGAKQLAAAADIRAPGHSTESVHTWLILHRAGHPHLAAKGRGGIGYYPTQKFCHCDTGAWRSWTG
jgi:uncharacterized protein YcbK (DUF882 family)